MTDFFSTRFAKDQVDAPEPSPSFVADLRRQLQAEWADDREALEMVMTQERTSRPAPHGPRRGGRRRYALLGAAAALVAMLIGVVVATDDDDTSKPDVVDQPTTTTTTTAPGALESAGAIDKQLIGAGAVFQMVSTGTDLWYLSTNDLERMDPVAGTRTKVLRLSDGRGEESIDDRIVAANGSLYVAQYASGIVEVSGDGTSVLRRIAIPTIGAYRGLGITVGSDALWVTVDGGDAIVRVDLASGAVSDPVVVETDEFRQLVFDGTWLYATMSKGAGREVLRKLDPTTFEVQAETTLPVYLSRGALLVDDTLWVSGDVDSNGKASVSGVDLASMTIRAEVTPEGKYGQAMAERNGIIWVGMHQSRSLTGIDPATGKAAETISLESKADGAEGLVVAPDGSMWAWLPPNGGLARIVFND